MNASCASIWRVMYGVSHLLNSNTLFAKESTSWKATACNLEQCHNWKFVIIFVLHIFGKTSARLWILPIYYHENFDAHVKWAKSNIVVHGVDLFEEKIINPAKGHNNKDQFELIVRCHWKLTVKWEGKPHWFGATEIERRHTKVSVHKASDEIEIQINRNQSLFLSTVSSEMETKMSL